MNNIILQSISIPRPLQFVPSAEQAIYIEGSYDVEMNAYIQENYDYIRQEFHQNRIDFCYLPLKAKNCSASLLHHHNPNTPLDKRVECAFTTEEFVDILFNDKPPVALKPSIIIYQKYLSTPHEAQFLMAEFQKDAPQPPVPQRSWWKKMLDIDKHTNGHQQSIYHYMSYLLANGAKDSYEDFDKTLYMLVNWYDDAYWASMKKHGELLAEIDLKIHQLQEQGIDSLILKKILCQMVDENRPLSRLVITSDLRIILPDYHNMEIRMEPINKAIFLLFLRHEEGIRIKDLIDHRSELESFYTRLSRDDREKRRQTLDSILDPTNNSIHEKISRVRQAFIAKFEEDLAQNYFIRGQRSEAKRIAIDRNMVTWE